jgi:hypothetical protein
VPGTPVRLFILATRVANCRSRDAPMFVAAQYFYTKYNYFCN